MRSSWPTSIFKVLLVAALPMHVWTYKILMVPGLRKSHVFSLAAIAEGLINRGHEVTFFTGEKFELNLRELRNRTEVSVVTYTDEIDIDAVEENITDSLTESSTASYNVKQLVSTISGM